MVIEDATLVHAAPDEDELANVPEEEKAADEGKDEKDKLILQD